MLKPDSLAAMASMSRHQLRAARALLLLRQEVLAELAHVGVASIRRFENGIDITSDVVEALRVALEAEGVILLAPGTTVDGFGIGLGVALQPEAKLPVSTRTRLAAIDASPDQAALSLSFEKAGKVGRRTRSPYEPRTKPRKT